MALLAEPKRKAKFGIDPRNTSWSNDDSKFGQKMMEKMGWEKGKGLGANEDGMTDHIKASYKSDTRGLGCSLKDADAWIAHQDDFNELLKNLNSQTDGGDQENTKDEKKAVDGQKRYYGRFARGRVQTLRSTEDLDCIFGRRKATSEPTTPSAQSAANSDDSSDAEEDKRHGLTTVTSTSSVQEYFAKKMAEMKAKREAASGQNSPAQGREEDEQNTRTAKDKIKEKTPAVYGAVNFSYGNEDACDNKKDDKLVKDEELQSRGWYKDWTAVGGSNDIAQEVDDFKKKKKQKKDKKCEGDISENEKKEKGKKDKRKEAKPSNDDMVNSSDSVDNDENRKAMKKEKKKKKKHSDDNKPTNDMQENDVICEDDNIKQKKKRKRKLEEAADLSHDCKISEEEVETEGNGRSRKQKKRKLKGSSSDICEGESAEAEKMGNKQGKEETVHGDNKACKKEKKRKEKNIKTSQSESETVENQSVNDLSSEAGMGTEVFKVKKSRKRKAVNSQEEGISEGDMMTDGTLGQAQQNNAEPFHPDSTQDEPATSSKANSKKSQSTLSKHERKLKKKERKKRKKQEEAALEEKGAEKNQWFPGSNVAKIKGYGLVNQNEPNDMVSKSSQVKKSKSKKKHSSR